MHGYKTIKDEIVHEYIIKKSRFICHIKHVKTIDEAQSFISECKKRHQQATHNCSAYIVNANEKADDDGEPSQTAGLPMLEVLRYHNLNYVVAVVTRYFGGIKLGSGGLIRAYSKSIANALEEAKIVDVVPGYEVVITFAYNLSKIYDHAFKTNNYPVIKKDFNNLISYTLEVKQQDFANFNILINSIDHNTDLQIIKELYIV